MFEGMEKRSLVFGIPAVKESSSVTALSAALCGSENNDPFIFSTAM